MRFFWLYLQLMQKTTEVRNALKKKKNKRPFHIQHTGWIVLDINKLSKTRAYVKKYYMYCCWKAEEHLFAY